MIKIGFTSEFNAVNDIVAYSSISMGNSFMKTDERYILPEENQLITLELDIKIICIVNLL